MKKRMTLISLLLAAVVAVGGCGEGKKNSDKTTVNTGVEAEDVQQEVTSSDTEEKDTTENDAHMTAENTYTWQEITVTLPESWQGKYVVDEGEDGFWFYQKASYDIQKGTGYLCGFTREKEWLNYGTGEAMLAFTDDGDIYYLIQPTDFACATEEGECAAEYQTMEEQVNEIADTININLPGVHFDVKNYVIPISSNVLLTKDALLNMSDNELWIARNEIYARHGRGFDNEYLQRWFDACSWYEKTKEAGEFDDAVLSQIEKDNLDVIKEAEEDYAKEHPYPKEYRTGTVVKEDISGDGVVEEIRYDVTEKNDYDYDCILTINGTAYDLNQYEPMITPMIDVFYVTDITEYEAGLEIAVLDEGPSCDYVTHFYRYDENGLEYIGSVGGFPFKEQNSGRNGFSGMNGICGTVRMDLLETCYLDGYWWYDEYEHKLVYNEDGEHNYQPNTSHQLLMDLPVWDTNGNTKTVIPAGQNIYFLRSDMTQWIYVRAKDGTEGYIQVKDDKILNVNAPAEAVFSDLYYFD